MKFLARLFAACILAGSLATVSYAQATNTRPPTPDDEAVRAIIVFTRILDSKEKALDHVAYLATYRMRAPWQFSTLVEITQRLAVMGFDIKEVDASLVPCGDMAAALTTEDDDERFARIVFLIFELTAGDLDGQLVRDSLLGLEGLGVPITKLLSEATGLKPAKVRDLIMNGRLRGGVAKRVLLDGFTRHYGGLAAKLADEKD
jgi:hypothetical protein